MPLLHDVRPSRWVVVVLTALAVALAFTLLVLGAAPVRTEHRTRLDNFDRFFGTLNCGSVIMPKDVKGTPSRDCDRAVEARRDTMVLVATRGVLGSLALGSGLALIQLMARQKRFYDLPR